MSHFLRSDVFLESCIVGQRTGAAFPAEAGTAIIVAAANRLIKLAKINAVLKIESISATMVPHLASVKELLSHFPGP
jgi:hypothetical protein